ncbi:tyrosine-protein kinase receptor Tie-1-like, partial [Saccoglossus kowalevskii]|uniref:Tyrosine-protein kinase receptor Tie-1-like n=1 Tax=Saccoglossus kowalevskii TaxID=10224 RepID=A0ABM0MP66_SACKO
SPLPIRWMAIESLSYSIYTIQSDVWSFGITMHEIITLGSTPYCNLTSSEVIRKLNEGYRLQKPDHCDRDIYILMKRCWDDIPTEIPTFSDIFNQLHRIMNDESKLYLKMNKYDQHLYVNLDKNDCLP